MLIKLDETHRESLLSLVSKEKELNLFIIGDVENHGFEKSFVEYWGQFENEKMTGVLMRFYKGFTVYALDKIDVNGVMEVIGNFKAGSLNGGKRIIDQFDINLKGGTKRDTYFAKLESKKQLVNSELLTKVTLTNIDDLEDINVLLGDHIEEFGTPEDLKRKRNDYKSKEKRGYHIRTNEGVVIANAETTAENSQAAMIVSVATHPDYRHKGYGTAVVSKLCEKLLEEGKNACLFYDNPKAGEIYKRIGFEDIDQWTMWQFASDNE